MDKTLCMYDYAKEMFDIEEELNKNEEFRKEDDIVKELVVLAVLLERIGG